MKKNKLLLGVLGIALTTMTILSGCGGSTGTETTY
jgi:hypothetical protein